MIQNIIIRNFKGISGKFSLTQRVNLLGENGTGKSTILQAIEIGLTGFSSKLGKKVAAILAYASDKVMEISVESDTGDILTRRLEKKGANGSQTIYLNGVETKEKDLVIPSSLAFPVEAIHPGEFLALSGDKRAEWLFKSLGTSAGMFQAEEYPVLNLKGAIKYEDLQEKLAAVLKLKKGEVERCEANLQKLTGQTADLPSGTLGEWKEKLAQIEKDLEETIKANAGNEEKAKLYQDRQAHIEKLRQQVAITEKKISESNVRWSAINSEMSTLTASGPVHTREHAISTLQTVKTKRDGLMEENNRICFQRQSLQEKIDHLKSGSCPICGTEVEFLQDKIGEYEFEIEGYSSRLDEIKAEIIELQKQIQFNEHSVTVGSKLKELKTEQAVVRDAMKSYEKTLADQKADLAESESAAVPETSSTEILTAKIEGLRQAKAQAREAIEKFQRSVAVKDQKSKAEEERQKLNGEIEAIKEQIKAAKKMRDEWLGKAIPDGFKAPLQTVVEAAFPGSEYFLEILDPKEKVSLDFGIKTGDRVRSFDVLSGGEQAVFLGAVVAALQIAKCGKAKIGLFEMAEADAKRTAMFAAAVEKIGFEQVVIASCHGQEMTGWQTITMGNPETVTEINQGAAA